MGVTREADSDSVETPTTSTAILVENKKRTENNNLSRTDSRKEQNRNKLKIDPRRPKVVLLSSIEEVVETSDLKVDQTGSMFDCLVSERPKSPKLTTVPIRDELALHQIKERQQQIKERQPKSQKKDNDRMNDETTSEVGKEIPKKKISRKTGPHVQGCKGDSTCTCAMINSNKRMKNIHLHNLLVEHQNEYKHFQTPKHNDSMENDLNHKSAKIGSLYFIELRFGTEGQIVKYGLYDPGADASHMRKDLMTEIRELEDDNVIYSKKEHPWEVKQAYDTKSELTHECSIPVGFADDPTEYIRTHGWNECPQLAHAFIAGNDLLTESWGMRLDEKKELAVLTKHPKGRIVVRVQKRGGQNQVNQLKLQFIFDNEPEVLEQEIDSVTEPCCMKCKENTKAHVCSVETVEQESYEKQGKLKVGTEVVVVCEHDTLINNEGRTKMRLLPIIDHEELCADGYCNTDVTPHKEKGTWEIRLTNRKIDEIKISEEGCMTTGVLSPLMSNDDSERTIQITNSSTEPIEFRTGEIMGIAIWLGSMEKVEVTSSEFLDIYKDKLRQLGMLEKDAEKTLPDQTTVEKELMRVRKIQAEKT